MTSAFNIGGTTTIMGTASAIHASSAPSKEEEPMNELTTKQYQALWAIPGVTDVLPSWQYVQCLLTNGDSAIIHYNGPDGHIDSAIDNLARLCAKQYAAAKIDQPAPESHAALLNAMRFS